MREMKESGIPWIGKIAKDVSIYTLKYGTYMKGRIGWQGLKSSDFINEGPFCVTSTDFRNGRINWDTCYHVSEKRYDMDPYIQIQKGDLLISKDGTIGKLALVDNLPDKACLNSHLLIIRPLNHNLNVKYLYYVLDSPIFTKYYSIVGSGSTMQSLSQEKLGNFKLPMWEINQQQAITNYLDAKCVDIDALQQDLQAEIETLQAYKKSLITRAVTQGLDPQVEMKDSGVEWIGKIPKTWNIIRLKNICTIKTGSTPDKKHQAEYYSCESGIPWIKAENLGNFSSIEQTKEYLTNKGVKFGTVFKENMVYVCCIGSIGKTGYSKIPCSCNQQINALSFNEKYVNYKFGFYMSIAQEKEYSKRASGNVLKIINTLQQSYIPCIIPPLKEQIEITRYLDSKCDEIDSIIASKQKQSEILSDYKKSLIYEVVTGKKEVPVHE